MAATLLVLKLNTKDDVYSYSDNKKEKFTHLTEKKTIKIILIFDMFVELNNL